MLRDGLGRVLQCRRERLRRLVEDRVGLGRPLDQSGPASLQAIERLLQRGGRRRPHRPQLRRLQAGAVHGPGTIDQVVRFVDEHADAPCVRQRQAVQQRGAVEEVVVVADDHVAPARHLLAEVVRAHPMRKGDLAQRLARQRAGRHGRRARRRQAVVEAPGERARLAVAHLVGVLAGLVAGNQFDHPQRHARARFAGASPVHPAPVTGRSPWPSGRRPCRVPGPGRP